MRAEIEYLTDMFCENGHDRETLQKAMNNFEKNTGSISNNNSNNNNNNNNDKKQTITFPWIPKIGPKFKKEIQKLGFRVAFQTGHILENILCIKGR